MLLFLVWSYLSGRRPAAAAVGGAGVGLGRRGGLRRAAGASGGGPGEVACQKGGRTGPRTPRSLAVFTRSRRGPIAVPSSRRIASVTQRASCARRPR